MHRRGPQRQVADLRAGQHQGHRPPADRDLQPADPHGRPRGGQAPPRLRRAGRVPHSYVGGHRHRRAEELGHAVHRGPRGRAAALVRRRRRLDRLRRRHEHRPDPAHRAHHRRRRRGPGRRDAAVRLRSGGGGARDRAQGARPAGNAGRGRPGRGRSAPAGPDRRPRHAAGARPRPGDGLRVLLVDHQDSFVHTLAGYFASRARRSAPCARASTPACSTSSPRTSWCCRRDRAARPTSTATSC